ncbi:MAG: carbon monoxide dehydrogenase subunit G [Burkholderiales bacterium]
MEISGEQRIALSQQRVWEALNDPEILKVCIAGCESIERVSDNEYKVAMTAAIGPVKAKFSGKLLLSDLNPPNSYSLAFEGSGGAAGFGKGSARVTLATNGEVTLLTYKATASVGGKLAQIGSRLIDGVAKKMSDDFFAKFNATVATAEQPVAEAVTAHPPATKFTLPVWAWVGGAIALLLMLLYLTR